MSKQPDIKPDDFPHISNAFQVIGQIHELPSSFLGFTSITRDEQTGRIEVRQSSDEELLTPAQILDALKNMPSYVAESRSATRENIELVASLGIRALEGLSEGKREYSKTALLGLQRTLRNIGTKTAIAFLPSDLSRRETAQGLASLNEIVNPNPRLAKWRQAQRASETTDESSASSLKEKGILE